MQKRDITYNVGDIVRFRTREISFIASRMAGTASSKNLNEYPEQEAIGRINQVLDVYDGKEKLYVIIEEHGFMCSTVFPVDIISILK